MSESNGGRGERLQLMLSPEELMLIDDFRFKARMPSRAAAVRELMRRGLTVEGWNSATLGVKSGDFGITANSAGAKQNNPASGRAKR